jgi:hypothetical protein
VLGIRSAGSSLGRVGPARHAHAALARQPDDRLLDVSVQLTAEAVGGPCRRRPARSAGSRARAYRNAPGSASAASASRPLINAPSCVVVRVGWGAADSLVYTLTHLVRESSIIVPILSKKFPWGAGVSQWRELCKPSRYGLRELSSMPLMGQSSGIRRGRGTRSLNRARRRYIHRKHRDGVT